jgi:hypothetical protein
LGSLKSKKTLKVPLLLPKGKKVRGSLLLALGYS